MGLFCGHGPILRTWVRALLDYARNAVVSLNWRPFLLSHLKCGSHVELLELVRGLECLEVKTRRTVPFLIDMKIFYALLKMSVGASYAPWHVDHFLLGDPLLYGVWHPYKYSVEITYKAFAPIIEFLEQGWDLKAGVVVPMKIKLRHVEKTIVGLFLATAANIARLDSTDLALRLALPCRLDTSADAHHHRKALADRQFWCDRPRPIGHARHFGHFFKPVSRHQSIVSSPPLCRHLCRIALRAAGSWHV